MKQKLAAIISLIALTFIMALTSCAPISDNVGGNGTGGNGNNSQITIKLPPIASSAIRALTEEQVSRLQRETKKYRVTFNGVGQTITREGEGTTYSATFPVGTQVGVTVYCLNAKGEIIVRTVTKNITISSGANSLSFKLSDDGTEIIHESGGDTPGGDVPGGDTGGGSGDDEKPGDTDKEPDDDDSGGNDNPPAPAPPAIEYVNITFNQGYVYTNTVHQSPSTWQDMTGAALPNSGQREKGSTVSADQATATGYVFKGWVADSSTPNGGAPDTQNFTYVHAYTDDAALYAIWEQLEPGSHSVKFAGGTTTGSSASGLPQGFQQKEGIQATFSGTPTCPGYEFAGWNADVAGVTVTQQGNGWEFTMPDSDVTLTAQWNVITYTVSYEANDGQATPAQTETFTVAAGGANVTLKAANTFTRTGYTFANWSAGGSNSYNPSTDISKTSLMALATGTGTSRAITLTAQWTINSYKVTYALDGGSGGPAGANVQYNASVSLDAPTKTGYTFGGWSDGNTTYGGTSGNDSLTMPAQAITLTAQWSPITYTVRYNKNANDATGTMADSNHTYGVSATLTANEFIRTNYTFTGWATSTTGSKTYSNSANVSNLKNVQGEVMELYAVWSPIQYNITYSNTNGGTGSASTTGATTSFNIETPSITLATEGTLEKIAYQFAGWETTDGKNTDVSNMNAAQLIALITSGDTLALQAKWIDGKRTVLYPDGTLIINELPNARRQDTPTAVYAAMKDDGSNYVFSSSYSNVLWYNDRDSITSVEIGSDISPTSTVYWFYGCTGLTTLTFGNNFSTSNVTSMASMFNGCSNLTSLDLSNFDTSNVTSMYGMFENCSGLTILTFGNSFDTSKVTTMYSMFRGCTNLTSLDVSTFNTSKVTSMINMFSNCSGLTTLTFGNSFDTSNVTTMMQMFSGCSNLTSLDLSSFSTSSVTDMNRMFASCSGLTTLTFGNSFDTSNVTTMEYMFYSCSGLTTLDITSFDTSNVTIMASMFNKCSKLTSLDLSNFVTSRVSNVAQMFYDCSNLTKIYATDNFVTSRATTSSAYNYMFSGCSKLIGGKGTQYSSSNTDKTYARIDGGPDSDTPGYFTDIADKP